VVSGLLVLRLVFRLAQTLLVHKFDCIFKLLNLFLVCNSDGLKFLVLILKHGDLHTLIDDHIIFFLASDMRKVEFFLYDFNLIHHFNYVLLNL